MRILSRSATTHRGQQTLDEAVNSYRILKPVTGVHRRFELPREESKLDGDRDHEYVVLNFSEVQEVIDRDGDLKKVLEPHHIRIIVANEDDKILDERSFQDVLSLLKVVQPAIYVPDIVYNYSTMDKEAQELAIDAYLYHVRSLQRAIDKLELAIRLIPTNKGWTVEHFEKYRDHYEDFTFRELAFYCVQYTGGDAGNAKRKIRRHISNAIAALRLENVFVIGRLAREELLRFEPEVKGACGLRQATGEKSFPEWKELHERALFANNYQTQTYFEEHQ